MAKKDITLTSEQWAIVYRAVSRASAARDVETQYKQHKLWQTLRDGLDGKAGDITVALLPWQRTMIDAVLANPTEPWLVQGLPFIWEIRETFGWAKPKDEDFDDDEAD